MPYRPIPYVLALFLLSPPASADITGQPRVIDGDTLAIDGQRIRLHGIDAPESKQLCHLDGKRWQCGKDAGNILSDLINRQAVTCEERDRDRYRRIVAVKLLIDQHGEDASIFSAMRVDKLFAAGG